MRIGFRLMLAVALCAGSGAAYVQAAAQEGSGQKQSQQNAPAAPAANVPQTQSQGNPFPGSTNNVPILPSGPNVNVPPPGYEPETNRVAFPPQDQDPVRSPDEVEPDSGSRQGFSSSLSGVDNILPPPSQPGKNGKGDAEIMLPHATPENDISVGNYYMSTGNWRAALSRFQSALVLEPQNPDVYWGLAESERHLGDFALAREHYLKVLEFDPGSKHAKKAEKALRNPEIAKAKAAPANAQNDSQQ